MIKHRCIGAIAVLLMAAAMLVIVFAYLNPSVLAAFIDLKEPTYVSAVDKTKIMDIKIIADETEWANMLENATAEEYIPATVIIDGMKIENVGIRPKGNSSLSMVAQDDTTDRFSFKIEFDHYITGQTWLGLDKIVVNNMQGDASYMKEYLSYDLMNYVGVKSPLYAFADISVNGEVWGFYLAVEALDDSYARRIYGNNHGKLYKPESMGVRGEGRMNEFIGSIQGNNENANENAPQMQEGEQNQAPPIQGEFPPIQMPQGGEGNQQNAERGGFGGMASNGVSLQYTDSEISSYSAIFDNSVFDATNKDYERVVEALKKLANGEDLENAVDVEATLKYFAAQTVVVNLDSYASNMGHNYYLYEDNGQITMLPWDYNLAFGGFQSGNASSVVNFPIDTPVSGVSLEDRPLLGKLLEVPEYLELYHRYLKQIVDGYFDSGLFEQTVDDMNALITSHVESDPTAFYDFDTYKSAVIELKKLGLLRAESIKGQLDGSVPSTSEEQSVDSSKLVDASSINLSALGNQGGFGGFGGIGSIGLDPQTTQKAMEIIRAAGGNGLTEEQLTQLKDLGLTDEQIIQLKNMRQGGIGAGGNFGRPQNDLYGMQGADRETMQKAIGIIQASSENQLVEEQLNELKALGLSDEQIAQLKNIAQGGFAGMGGGPPNNAQGRGDNIADGQSKGFGNQQSVITSGFDTSTWLFMGGCTALLFWGLVFVFCFKRRRNA